MRRGRRILSQRFLRVRREASRTGVFRSIQLKPDVMAMAIGPDDFAAYQVTSNSSQFGVAPPKEPVWALIPASALQDDGFTAGCREGLRAGVARRGPDRI